MSRARIYQVTAADRRFLRWLPITLLFQRQPDQPERLFREFPQLHRLLRAKLISTSYDASAHALTINRGTGYRQERRRILGAAADELEAEEFLLNPVAEVRP